MRQVSIALDAGLVFGPHAGKAAEAEQAAAQLAQLALKLEGLQLSLEYVSDYVKIAGVQMWQQEFSRVVNFFVEQECATYLRRRTPPERSKHQSVAAPIALHPNGGGGGGHAAGTFVGRLARTLLHLASTRRTAYSEALGVTVTLPLHYRYRYTTVTLPRTPRRSVRGATTRGARSSAAG